jgi:phosphate:Na+ symporter
MVMNPFNLALVNTILRLAMVILLLPFTKLLEALVKLLVKDKGDETQVALRLEERFLAHPALALEQSRLTMNDMAQCAKDAFGEAIALLVSFSEKAFASVEKLEGDGDRYEDALGSYLLRITTTEMTAEQNEALHKFLHTIADFERISDHANNISECAQEMHDKNIVFSEESLRELEVLRGAVTEIVDLTIRAFVDDDVEMALRVEPLEELIDGLCDEMKNHHIDRLQRGVCTLQHGFVFNDLLTNFERVGDHCSNVAVAMIELAEDDFDTHEYLDSLKLVRTAAFDQYYDEYKKKYAI